MNTTCIRIEGGLLSPDFLESIHTQDGQKPKDFGVNRSLVDEIASVWADAQTYWKAFERRRAHASTDSITTITREQWVSPLLEALGYRLVFQRRAAEVDGRTYAISHRALSSENQQSKIEDEADAPPVHIVGYDLELGNRPPAGRGTLSPHGLVQDYLNRSEHLWGIVTNGYTLRLLRDSVYFTRPAYIEFDLKQMLEGGRLDEFILFYRLAHRTRLPKGIDDTDQCWLERYHQAAVEQGGRIREGLRDAVEKAIITLANGFLAHPKNETLREKIRQGKLTAREFYRQLLYLIYRLLFLLVAEERNILLAHHPTTESPNHFDATRFYHDNLSIARLRALAEEPLTAPERFDDLYLGLRMLFYILSDEQSSAQLGLPTLNGELFNPLADLDHARLSNRALLEAIAKISYFEPEGEKVRRRVNYAALDVEELGSVYESLLEYQPVILANGEWRIANGERRMETTRHSPLTTHPLEFVFAAGTERKSTGSYYTAPPLVSELIQSALVPVLQERLTQARRLANGEWRTEEEKQAILSIKVCDPACGSGHFLLAAARTLGKELAKIEMHTDEPSPEAIRRATREVITHCIYGVDKNPLAVDLCKVALWLEGHAEGKPLTFLDHRIRCGDSLVGVRDLAVLEEGIPDEAFEPVAGDDKKIASALKKQNRQEREGQMGLPFDAAVELVHLSDARRVLSETPDETPAQIRKKRAAFEELQAQTARDRTACNLWTSAFFVELTRAHLDDKRIPTTDVLRRFLAKSSVDKRYEGMAEALGSKQPFFHWVLEFPEVFANVERVVNGEQRIANGDDSPLATRHSGFDVILCNPPWERIKLQEQEFFATRDAAIANAPNKAARERLIKQLQKENPDLWREYQQALHDADATSKFLRQSGRFPLTARGDINTYSVFAELFADLINPNGRVGVVVPTGIATDDTNKQFFGNLVETGRLVSLYDFENREKLFPAVDSRYKFCLLTLHGNAANGERQTANGDRSPLATRRSPATFVFFATRVEHLRDERRRFTLTADDFRRFNPNTRTCPVFRTKADAELTRKIYERVPVLVNEATGENPWGVSFLRMIDPYGGKWHLISASERAHNTEEYVPVYEGKMFFQYDHRLANVDVNLENIKRPAQPENISDEEKANPHVFATPQYWVSRSAVTSTLAELQWRFKWLLVQKKVTSATNERTHLAAILPLAGTTESIHCFILSEQNPALISCLLASLNALVFDFVARQKIGGENFNYFVTKQLPTLPPTAYTPADIAFIVPRVVELVYTAWDIKAFADDVWREADDTLRAIIKQQWEVNRAATGGHLTPSLSPDRRGEQGEVGIPLPPFKWDEDRRAILRAELDAYYARLYGLTRDELRYILDPKDVYGEDFPGETFRVLKEKEIRQYGEYRTRRLVLEKWDEMEEQK